MGNPPPPSFFYVSKVSVALLSSFVLKSSFVFSSKFIVVGSSAALVMVRSCLLGIKDKSFLLLSPHLPIRVHPEILIMSLTLGVSTSDFGRVWSSEKTKAVLFVFSSPGGGMLDTLKAPDVGVYLGSEFGVFSLLVIVSY